MALILRKANHGRMDIQGYSVAEWERRKEEQRRRKEAKRNRLDQAYGAGMATPSRGSDRVHYDVSIEAAEVVGGGLRVRVEEGRPIATHTGTTHTSVDVSPS